MNRLLILGVASALFGFAGISAPARAGLLPVNTTITPESGNSRWTYAIVLPSDVQIKSGDYFTIYDFAGYVPGSNSQPAGWSYSTNLVGPTPSGLLPTDNPKLPNLTWTYNGAPTTGQTGLGNFWAVSQYSTGTTSNFTALSQNATYGIPDSNITTTTVPVEVPAPPGVPEPTTLLLAGLGLPFVGFLRRRKARKAAGIVSPS
jgi:hypothetical protein